MASQQLITSLQTGCNRQTDRRPVPSITEPPHELNKTRHHTLALNFANCWLIFKILSPVDSVVNMQRSGH